VYVPVHNLRSQPLALPWVDLVSDHVCSKLSHKQVVEIPHNVELSDTLKTWRCAQGLGVGGQSDPNLDLPFDELNGEWLKADFHGY
jgi:hypothetical protein